MYVVIFCFGLGLVALEILASKRNGRTAAASTPVSRWLRIYRWRYLMGLPFAIASSFISYPLSSGEDHYQITGFPFLVLAIDQRGWDYVGFLSLPFLVINALVGLFLRQSLSGSRQCRARRVPTVARSLNRDDKVRIESRGFDMNATGRYHSE